MKRRIFRCHSLQHLRHRQFIVVHKLPLSHLDPQRNGMEQNTVAVEGRSPQVAAAVAYNVPNHTKHLEM